MGITTSERATFRAGASYNSYQIGYEPSSGTSRVIRYAFQTPAEGVSRLSFNATALAHGTNYEWQGLGYYISSSPTAYVNAGPSSPRMGTLSIAGNGSSYDIAGAEAEVNLPANITAYIFIFPIEAKYFFWNFVNVTELNVSTKAGASTILSCPAELDTLETLAISMRRAGESFTHIASFKCGETLLHTSEVFGEALSVDVPRAWLEGFPNEAYISMSVSIQTYAGTTPAGAPATREIRLNADPGMRPVIMEAGASIAPYNTGAASGMRGYIRGFSRAEASFDESKIDLSACAGASIAGYSLTCAGETVSAAPYRSPILTDDTAAVLTVTDSRGRTASISFQLATLPYAPPSITGTEVFRCDASGSANDDASYIYVKATLVFSSVDGQNGCRLYAALTNEGGGFGEDAEIEAGAGNVLYGTVSPDRTYSLRLTARDSLGGVKISTVKLPTRLWAMKFRESGLGVAFGMAPQQEKALELPADWKIRIGESELTADKLSRLLAMLT